MVWSCGVHEVSPIVGWVVSCGINWGRLDGFWQQRLPGAREPVSWEKVLQLRVVNNLIDYGSDFHRTTAPAVVRTSRWLPRTGCIAVWIACCHTNRS
jgi:hypothetical protein